MCVEVIKHKIIEIVLNDTYFRDIDYDVSIEDMDYSRCQICTIIEYDYIDTTN